MKRLKSSINSYRLKSFFGLMLILNFPVVHAQTGQGLNIGDIAPDFTVTDMNGVQHHLYNYLTDGKYVVLKFGFAGCSSCELSRPGFNNAYRNFGCNEQDVIFLEFDVTSNDSQISPSFWVSANLADQQAYVPNSTQSIPSRDIDYVYPEAPYITTSGGSQPLLNLYNISAVSYECVIEPLNKTIVGASEYPNTINGGPYDAWEVAFSSGMVDGNSSIPQIVPGTAFMAQMLDEKPDAFIYVQPEYVAEFTGNFAPLFNVPLNGTNVGDTPFKMFCDNNLTGCNLMKPTITSQNVTSFSDSTYRIELNWSSPQGCNSYIVKYGLKGGSSSMITTTQNSLILEDVYSGRYYAHIRCECNDVASYETVEILVEPKHDFSIGTTCEEVCQYELLTFGALLPEESFINYTWGDSLKVRIESENTIEYYTLDPNSMGEVDGATVRAQNRSLLFCKNSDINIQYIDPGFEFNNSLYYSIGGFRFINDQDNIVVSETGSSSFVTGTLLPSNHPGYFNYPTIISNCNTSLPASINSLTNMNNIQIYPVPFNQQIHIDGISAEMSLDKENFSIHTISGQRVRIKFRKEGDLVVIDTDHLQNGTYILTIQSAKQVLNKIIVKQE